jgi:putative tryptophan/tyrosine transport system substrate-binding protein
LAGRRTFVLALGAGLAAVAARLVAQESRRRRLVGYLASSPPKANGVALQAFRDGLRDRGYVEGRDFAIEPRWTNDDVAGLPKLAAELVHLGVDVILAWTTPVVIAAKRATTKIPIVMVGIADPVGSGLVASLSRPGGNVTGVSNLSADLSSKLVELLGQLAPGATKVFGVRNALNPSSALQLKETEAAARAKGLQFELIDIREPRDLARAFTVMARSPTSGAVFFADPLFVSQRARIGELALKHRLPTVFARRENVDAGGLIAYGPNLSSQFYEAADYVDKILKGADPAALPVELPTKLELIINLKTAKAIGVTVPRSLLYLADDVIQ